MKALVVGGGPAGLLTAFILGRYGWDVQVVEAGDDPRYMERDSERTYEIVLMERGLQALAKAGIKEPEEGLPRCYGVVNHAAGVEGKATVKPSASTGYRSVYGVRQEIASMILTEIDAANFADSVSCLWGYRIADIDLSERKVTANRVPEVASLQAERRSSTAAPKRVVSASRRSSNASSMLSVESASASDINEADIATAGRPDNGLSESEDDEAEVAERTLSYDLLIGADGAHSVVRAAMELHLDDFTAEVTPSGWGYYTARCQEPGESLVYPDHAAEKGYHLDTTSGWIHVLPGAKPVPDAFYGGKSRPTVMMLSSLRGTPMERAREEGKECRLVMIGPTEWLDSMRGGVEGALETIREQWGAHLKADVARQLAEEISEKDSVNPGGFSVKCSRLHGDRVVLVGDAGHSMLPSLGLGCNTALESAVVLGRALKGCKSTDDIQGAIEEYNEQRLEDVKAAVDMSLDFLTMRAPLFASTVALAVASKVFPFLPTPALFRIRSAEALARLKKDLDRTLRDAAIGTFLLVAPVLVALALLVLWTSRGGVRGSGVAGGLGEVGGGAEL